MDREHQPPSPPGIKPPKPPRRRGPPRNPDDNPGGSGRPSKFTTEVALAICESVLHLNYRYQAAAAYGIGKRTLETWLRMGDLYPDGNYGAFRRLLLECEKRAETYAVETVRRLGEKDGRLLLELLARRFPKRYAAVRLQVAEYEQRVKALEKALAAERREREREAAAFDETP